MWDVPNSRIHAYLRGQKRSITPKNNSGRLPHFKRTEAEIIITSPRLGNPARIVPARLLLNDLNPRGLFVFSRESLPPGQEIALQIQHLNNLYVRARVFTSNLFALRCHVLTDRPMRYRVGICFHFENEAERSSFRNYCDGISQTFLRNSY